MTMNRLNCVAKCVGLGGRAQRIRHFGGVMAAIANNVRLVLQRGVDCGGAARHGRL